MSLIDRIIRRSATGAARLFSLGAIADGQYLQRSGQSIIGSAGPTASGSFLRTVVLASGTSYTTGSGCNKIRVRMVAGGGGGGGSSTGALASGVGGGGSAAGYLEVTVAVSPSTAYTYAVGAGGTAGADTGGTGGTGGSSTLAVGATTYLCSGGLGGVGMVASTTPGVESNGGAGPTASVNGDLNVGGMPGSPGIFIAVGLGSQYGGAGGSGPFGAGGTPKYTNGAGVAGTGYGSGGGGGNVVNGGTKAAGAVGQGGVLVIDEFS